MDRKRVRFVVNPISGTRGKESIVRLIPEYMAAERFDWDIVYTKKRGHASELAKEAAAEGFDIVVAVGGDGTVNEVARSLVHTQSALAIIPCGSGNGLARHLLIPINPVKALKILVECNIEALDYGKINDQPFFCTCGIGFDAFISDKFAKAGKRGLMTYVDNALKEGFTYKPETYQISIDGEKQTHEAFLIACANASQYGNNVYIAPAASMNDGLMDVTIMEPFNFLEAAQVVVQLLNKTIDKNSHARTFQCSKLHIHRENPGVVHYDGDPMECGTDIDVEIVRQGIRIVVNNQPQKLTSPLFRAFVDIQDKMDWEMNMIREDFRQTNERIKRINSDLLKKLRNDEV
ncbi:MAG: diacylglycerol kinase family lipid kinase [Bacteroidaceae bacterium]|nr:diacylglycerol kinase family lipid kinase [Bacteroidaceae bacterium]